MVHGGVIVPLPVSYEHGMPAFDKMARHIEWLAQNEVDGVWILGTTGDFLYHSYPNKKEIILRMAREAKHRNLTVYCGIWDTDPRHINQLAEASARAGADAVFALTPLLNPVQDDELPAYYECYVLTALAHRLPFYLYDFPQRTANQLSLEVVKRLHRAYPHAIRGIKDSSGDFQRLSELSAVGHTGQFAALAGTSTRIAEARSAGASGVVAASANIAPRLVRTAWNALSPSTEEQLIALDVVLKSHGGSRAINEYLAEHNMAGEPTRPHQPLPREQKAMFFNEIQKWL